ncbi:LysR family transcriptional regulator [Burkholderia sp. MSMB1552]|nr:LysR family transcriptional regulator [Burkholderia sp. MSMB1552]
MVEMLELAENIEIRPTMTTNLLTALERIVAAKTFITLIGESAAYLQIAAGESTTVPIVHPIFEGAHARLIAKSGRPLALAPVELVGWIKMWLAVFSAAGGNDGKGKGGTASGEGFIRRLIEQRPSIAARLRCAEKRPSSRISIQSKFLTWFIDHPFRHPPSATPRFPRHRVSVLRRERPTPLVRRTQPRPSRKNLLRPDFISQDRFTNIQQNL